MPRSTWVAQLSFASCVLSRQPGDLKSQCPPLGAVAVLLFCMPGAPASSTRAVVLGHIVGSLAALTCVMGLPGPYAPGLAVGLAVTGMKLFDCVHPPAAAYAFLFAANGWGPKQVLAPGLLGAVILVVVQRIWTQLTATVVKPKTA